MHLDPSAFVAAEELVRTLRNHAKPVHCTEDRVLFRQGDQPNGLYIFHSGDVILRLDAPDGHAVASMPVSPGSLLGLPGLVGNTSYSMTAEARVGAQLSFITRDEFSRLMLTEPSLAMQILRVLAAEVRSARIAIANS